MQSGYLTLGRVRGAVVRIHWSAFAIALLLGYNSVVPWWASLLGSILVVGLIMAHEFGHAIMVWRYRQRVDAIEVFAFHGWCRWRGDPDPYQRAMIAWGGVFAQLALCLAVLPVALLVKPRGIILHEVVHVFVWTNLYLAAINLIPIAPLDGAETWKVFAARRARRAQRMRMDDLPAAPRPKARRPARTGERPHLRLVPPPADDDEPVSESSRRIAEDAILDALERSRRKFGDRDRDDE